MFPAKPLDGKLLKLLKDELDGGFSFDPYLSEDEDEDDFPEVHNNLMKFCLLCDEKGYGGLKWLNALHSLGRANDENDEFHTPLTYIASRDPHDWKTTHLLVEMGADPNIRDGKGEPPLNKIVMQGMGGRWRTGKALLDGGANPMAFYKGKAVAYWAKECGKDDKDAEMIWNEIKEKLSHQYNPASF